MVSTSKKRKKNNKSHSGLGDYLVTLGLLITLVTLILGNYTTFLNIFHPPQQIKLNKSNPTDLRPTTITFPNKQISVPIGVGTFEDNSWYTSDSKALYLDKSGTLGVKGNLVLYGHNTPEVFSVLHRLEVKDIVKLTTKDNKQFSYQITSIKTVSPTDVYILDQDIEGERLTLFTCTSLFDSMRLVAVGKRV